MKSLLELQNTQGLTKEDIDREVDERRSLISTMVGSLYPAIVSGEIDKLYEMKRALL